MAVPAGAAPVGFQHRESLSQVVEEIHIYKHFYGFRKFRMRVVEDASYLVKVIFESI